MILKLGVQHQVLKYFQIYSNDDTGLTLTIFMTWSNLFPNTSALVKAYTEYNQIRFQACSNSAYPMQSSRKCLIGRIFMPTFHVVCLKNLSGDSSVRLFFQSARV